MRSRFGLAASVLLSTGLLAVDSHGQTPANPELRNNTAAVLANYARLPLAFEREPNGARSRYVARGEGYSIGLENAKATLAISGADSGKTVSLEFKGSHPRAAVPGAELPGRVNYILGNDPRKWRTAVPTFDRVTYPDVYPGIDVVYYGNQQQLEFDLVVKPGADPGLVRLKLGGAGNLSIDPSGALHLGPTPADLTLALPKIYQDVNGAKKAIAGHYAIVSQDEVAFRVDLWDHTRPLVIDPTITYSALIGGGLNSSYAYGVGVDGSGNILITGVTYAADFPTLDAYQKKLSGPSNVFVTKINPAGTALIYSTYLGGSGNDQAFGLAVDSTGAAWVTGDTSSADFPLQGAAQTTFGANTDAFVARLNSSGLLQFSTYLGGNSYTYGYGLAVDNLDNGYVTGNNFSGSFPTTSGVIQQAAGSTFVAKYSSTGTLIYSTLLGNGTYGQAIAVDSSYNTYVTGTTYDNTFAGLPAGGAQPANNGGGDAFVAKLNPTASSLVYFTFLGGTGYDQGKAIAVDSKGDAYVAGQTTSAGLATSGAAQTVLAGATDGFAAELNPAGTQFGYITYLGGSRQDYLQGMALDTSGNLYLTGYTDSVNFPSVSPPQPVLPGNGISLFSSTNSAASFAGADSDIPGQVFQLSINPSVGTEVVMTESGIYRTTNGGASWTRQLNLSFTTYGSFLGRSPVAPQTIYATICCSSVYKSIDDGVTWAYAGNAPSEAQGIVADPVNAGTVYLFGGSSPYVFSSTNGGVTWNSAASGLPGPIGALVATTDGALYAGTYGYGIYKSTNQGGSWTAVNNGLPQNPYIYYPDALSASGTTVYFAYGNIYTTSNGGASWAATPGYISAGAVAASPQNPSILYAFTYNGTVMESSDGGTTWSTAGTGLPSTAFYYNSQLLVDPTNAAHALVITTVNQAAFVSKLNSTGSALIWSTYLGGPSYTYAFGVATDSMGNGFVTGGYSGSNGFPVTSTALPSGPNGAFITKISDATPACSSLTVNPESALAFQYGGTLTFTVVAPSGCAWTASSNESWALITSGASGTGSGVVTVQVAGNSSSSTRTATLTVGTQSVTITQPSFACSYSTDQGNYAVGAAGGPVTVVLTVTAGCPWALTNNYPAAITVTSGGSGNGNGTIQLTVAPNYSSYERDFYFNVGNTSFSVDQQSAALVITTNSVPGGAVGAYYAATLAAGGGTPPYTWSVVSGSLPPGLTLSAGTGLLSGIPTTQVNSPFTFGITVKDSAGVTSVLQTLTIGIGPFATYAGQNEVLNAPRSASNQPLLFPFVTNEVGFDTGFTIVNTSKDTLGTAPKSGTCTISFYGAGAPSSNTVAVPGGTLAAGATTAFTLSSIAPGFQGYAIVNCNFPLVRGTADLIYNAGAANSVSLSEAAQVLSLPRNVPSSQSFLIPFATNQEGFDTGIAIANTSSDPLGASGATPVSGTCSLNFYGQGGGFSIADPEGALASGVTHAFTVSAVAPGFQGYVIVSCPFGAAAVYSFASYALTQNNGMAFSIPVESIALPRSSVPQPLLFSAVTNQNGQDTAFVLANTSSDPFGGSGATAGSGVCTLAFYGTNAPSPNTVAIPTGTLVSGSTSAFLLSSVAPGFTGYMTASCPFGPVRGFAYVFGDVTIETYSEAPEVVATPRSTSSSSLLFSNTLNLAGEDTNIVIANTSQDSFGTAAAAGTCTITYFGSAGGVVPSAQTTPTIAAGTQYSFLLSQAAPGFRGYVEADCNFPLARGVAEITLPPGAVSITTGALPAGTVGIAYSQTLTAINGVPPYQNWTVASGSLPTGLTLNAATGVISGTPTTTTGSPFNFTVTVQDSSNNTSAAKSLFISIAAPPSPVIAAVSNNADFSAPPLAPGSLATIYGSLLAANTVTASSLPLPFTLGGVSVTVNGTKAALLFVSPGLINFQVPYETAVGTASVIVTNNGSASAGFQFNILPGAPGIFANQIYNPNFTQNTAANPTAPGSTATVYFTGLGATNPAVADGAGAPTSPLAQPVASTSVTVGGQAANVSFIGLTPGLVEAQANVQIPAGLQAGSYSVVITVNGRPSLPQTIYVSGTTSTLTSVTPSSAPQGSAATAITIAGSNFGGGSTVSFTPPRGSPTTITTTLVQAAQIAATIPAALLTSPGTAQVAVINGLGTSSNQVPFTIGPPPPVIASILSNADYSTPPLAPGSLATIYGSLLASSAATASGVPYQTTLNSVTVTVNGVKAPLLYVSAGLINFQVPYETAAGNATVVVTNSGSASSGFVLSVVPGAPGIFAGQIFNSNATQNTVTNPTFPGNTIGVNFTGLGLTTPAVADGAAGPATPAQAITSTSATVGGATVTATIGLSSTLPGVAQASITMPSGLQAGSYSVVITVNGRQSLPMTVYVGGASPSVSSVTPNEAPQGSAMTAITIAGSGFGGGSTVSFTPPRGSPTTISPSLIQAAQIAATIPAAMLTSPGTAQVAIISGLGTASNQVPFAIGPPAPAITSVRNEADNSAPPLAPGSLATIYGSLLASATATAATVPYPFTLSNVTVTVNGTKAALAYVSAGQINFQVPYETASGSATIVVTNNGSPSPAFQFSVVPAAPGIFAAQILNPNATQNTNTNPIAPGGTATVYFTGLGVTTPAVADGAGAPSPPLATPVASASVTFNGVAVTTPAIGLVPSLVGEAQASVLVPSGTIAGVYPVVVTVNGVSSAGPAFIYVSGSGPSLTSVTPNSVPAGSAGTPITIAGANFGGGTQVAFTPPGGTTISIGPSMIQAAQLAATIPAVLLTTAGTAEIAISNGLGTLSNQLPFTITQGSQTISFDALPNRILGVSPFAIAAQASSGLPLTITSTTPTVCKNSDTLVTLVSAGTCSITASQPGTTGYSAATPVTRSFTVSKAKVSGSFQAATGSPFSALGIGPGSVVAADFNNDGIPDIAAAGVGGVIVLLGQPSGGFIAASGSPFQTGAGSDPFAIAAGDFNADGFQDLVVTDSSNGAVAILLGNGSGAFSAATGSPVSVGMNPQSIVVGDFNGDGIQDFATANNGSNNISVLLGIGGGLFRSASGSPFSAGLNPVSIVVADFNRDGNQDLAAANSNGENITVLLGNGGGVFAAAPGSPVLVGNPPASLAVGDFNQDGVPDIATANTTGNVTVLLGNGSGGFTAAGSPFPAGGQSASIVVADLNGDGIPDLAAANAGSNNVVVLQGNGQGGFTPARGSPLPAGTYPSSIAVADFNGDGIEDLVTANESGGNLTVLLGIATGSASQTITFAQPSNVNYGPSLTIQLTASATSGLTVNFASTTSGVCTVAGSTVTLVAPGICSIVASQAGNATYAAAATVSRNFTVLTGSQTITVLPVNNVAIGAPSFTITATASSMLPVSFVSTTTTVCTVSPSGTVTIVGPGMCAIVVSQSGNADYLPAPNVMVNFSVGSQAATPSVTVLSLNPNASGSGGTTGEKPARVGARSDADSTPSISLTINGTGFTSNSVAVFNNNIVPITLVNPSQVVASVPASLTPMSGTATVSVGDSTPLLLYPPTVTSLSPTSASGTSAFTLTVNGSGFINGISTVYFNEMPLTTTFVSASQLTATVPPQTASNVPVSVVNMNTPSNELTFTLGAAQYSCNATSTQPSLRVGSLAELLGDIVITCPPGAGSSVIPSITIQPLNFSLFAPILDANSDTDALLLVNDPTPVGNNQQLGTNVFQGSVYQGLTGPSIQFNNVRLPNTSSTTTLRIVNLRANTLQSAQSTSVPLGSAQVQPAAIEVGMGTIAVTNSVQTLGLIAPTTFEEGTISSSGNQRSIPLSFGQTLPAGASSSVPPFRPRVAGATGAFGGCPATPAGVQDCPGYAYNTESGFVNPQLLPGVGVAGSGTRFLVQVNNVPSGAGVYAAVYSDDGVSACLVSTDSNGAGPEGPCVTGSGALGATYAPVSVSNGTAVAVWEVVAPNAPVPLNFHVVLTGMTQSGLGPVTLEGSLAPLTTAATPASFPSFATTAEMSFVNLNLQSISSAANTGGNTQSAASSQGSRVRNAATSRGKTAHPRDDSAGSLISIQAGSSVPLSFMATNQSAAAATNVTIASTVPSLLAVDTSACVSQGCTLTANANGTATVQAVYSSLAPGATAQLSYNATACAPTDSTCQNAINQNSINTVTTVVGGLGAGQMMGTNDGPDNMSNVDFQITPTAVPVTVQFSATTTTTMAQAPSLTIQVGNSTPAVNPSVTVAPSATLSFQAPTPQPGASNNTQFVFNSWNDGVMSAVHPQVQAPAGGGTYTASFDPQYSITLTNSTTGAVTQSTGGATTLSPASTGNFYSLGDPVQITATPAPGYVFTGFTGDITSATSPYSMAMPAKALNITANFTLATQTIAFPSIPTQVVTNPAFTLNASASSGLTVTFTSNSTSVCTVSGSTVTLVAIGTCSITATQPGTSVIAAAEPVTVTFTVQPVFSDVGDQTVNEQSAIALLASYGITTGCSTTPFDYCSDQPVTRGEMAVFIIRSIYGSNNFPYTQTPYFTDVPLGAQFYQYIQKMRDLGITTGETNTTYGPNDTVTRGEMAVFIIRARYGAGVAFNYSPTPYFTDVPLGAQFFQYIQKLRDVNITSGETATTYGPNDPVTRGEMALFVMRGAFNLLLPTGTPVLSTVSPSTGTAGNTVTVTITGTNTNFAQGTTMVTAGNAITVQNVTVNSTTSLTAQLVVASNATLGPVSIVATTGTQEAVAPNLFTITSDPATGILAYFTGNGTTVDAVSGLSGTLAGGATTYASATSRTQGLPDAQAFTLNGATYYVLPASGETATVSGARTLIAWVYPNSGSTAAMPILTGGPTSAAGDVFGITGTTGTCSGSAQYLLFIDHGGTCYTSDISLTPDVWSLVAVTFDGSNAVFFINAVASIPVPAQMFNYGLSTFEIGGNTPAPSFNGLLSEVQIYGRALTPAEVKGIYAP